MEQSSNPNEVTESRAIARWIREFLDPTLGIEPRLKEFYEEITDPHPTSGEEEERQFMARDSGITPD